MMKSCLFSLGLSLVMTCAASADPPEVVVEGLNNPCGVAVQPGTGHVFVADSAAGRVIRVIDGEIEEVITGFPLDTYGKGPVYNIGPLGLAFYDRDTLVVGGGEMVDTDEVVRVFTVPAAGEPAVAYDTAHTTLGPLDSNDELSAEGNYHGVAVGAGVIYATGNGDDAKGWIVRSPFRTAEEPALTRFLPTKEATQVDAPVAITLSPAGELVVGQMGEISEPNDGLLTFYSADDGRMLLNVATGLYDVTGLAYSQGSGQLQLYATDFAWMATDQGGLFRLDHAEVDGQQGCNAVRIATLDKPTALAFGPDGSLYVTVFGTPAEGEDAPPSGQLLRFAPGM